jgi:hypothetical protein
MFSVHLKFPYRHWRRWDFWNPTFFHHIWLGLCTTVSYEIWGVDLQTRIHLWFMHGCAPPYIPLADLEFLKSMACFFPWFQSLRFSSLGSSNVYCLCYRSQWHPELAKTNTELIFMTSGIFQHVRQSMYRHATSCVEAQGEGFDIFYHLQVSVTRNHASEGPCSCDFFTCIVV